MICKNCGVETNGNFCSNCGARFNQIEVGENSYFETNPQRQQTTANKKRKTLLKRWWFWLLIVILLIIFGSLLGKGKNTKSDVPQISLTEEELDIELALQKIRVISTNYLIRDEQHKALYPDMLQAIVKNDSDVDIKDIVISFVAWDNNGLPVKIKGDIDFSDGEYIKNIGFADVNLAAHSAFGESHGYEIDENCNINSFKAIVMSYETFEGESWENPLYPQWCALYKGTKNKSNPKNGESEIDSYNSTDNNTISTTDESIMPENNYSEEDLNAIIAQQPLHVVETNYIIQDEKYKSLYPDMLQAIIQNDTEYDIKNAIVAFVAWDSNNLPVKIKAAHSIGDNGDYLVKVNYSDINLVPHSRFGESNGFEIDKDCNISDFKAIVSSYTTFDGEEWNNPYFDEWCNMYEGKKMK